ncbi:MAG: hypothetical protein Q9227_002975 [Pyrenula ochraceoflavens]
MKTVLVPALISLVLYLVITYAILPVVRQHRQRYAQYLPLATITQRTSTLRERISEAFVDFLVPASWRSHRQSATHYSDIVDNDEGLFEDEEGENMVGFDVTRSDRDALERGAGEPDTQRRLSRELEEGFRDDSEEENDEESRRSSMR